MTEGERRAALERIAEEVRACTRCRLHADRTQAVPGEGHASTEVVFVGEAPGLNEDRQGRPFVGAAGQFLSELLGSVGWSRDEVFITNVVKCRPPQNRDPEPDEIAACEPYLRRQLEALDPALVVTLGRHSMGRFMPGARIGQTHGTYRAGDAEGPAPRALVFAMYHPAAALHQASLRDTLLDDMGHVPAALVEARRRRDETAASPEPAAAAGPEALAEPPTLPEPETLAEVATSAEPVALAEPAATPEPIASGPPASGPDPAAGPDPASLEAVAPVEAAVAPEPVAIPVVPDAAPGPIAIVSDRSGPDAAADGAPEAAPEAVRAVEREAPSPVDDDQMTLFLS